MEKFKHVVYLLIAIILGLSISKKSTASALDYSTEYMYQMVRRGKKKIWSTEARETEETKYEPTGVPWVNEDVCMRTLALDGELQKNSKGIVRNYCDGRCIIECPVTPKAIKDHEWQDGTPKEIPDSQLVDGKVPDGTNKSKNLKPNVDYDLCINCGLCFRNCGYHAIEWINSGEVTKR